MHITFNIINNKIITRPSNMLDSVLDHIIIIKINSKVYSCAEWSSNDFIYANYSDLNNVYVLTLYKKTYYILIKKNVYNKIIKRDCINNVLFIFMYSYFIYNKYYNFNVLLGKSYDYLIIIDKKKFNCCDFYKIFSFI